MRCIVQRMHPPISEEQIEHILHQMAEEKRSLSAICREDEGMPRMTSFLARVKKDADLEERYVCAREAQITSSLEEIIEIADDVTDDAELYTDPKTGRQMARINGLTARRAEVKIAARERFAKLMMPERFAQQRMDVTSGGKALPAPQHNDNRIVALLTLAAQRAQDLHAVGGKTIDVTPLSISDVMD